MNHPIVWKDPDQANELLRDAACAKAAQVFASIDLAATYAAQRDGTPNEGIENQNNEHLARPDAQENA